ncbi:MAG: AEC family transporter [Rhodospirillaceae bacterium]|nr:AEC family transporter [Rhodospirillaceae bacterium]
MLYQLFTIVVPVFVCAAIGFFWAKSGRHYDTEMVTSLVSSIGVPALVLSTLLTVDIDISALAEMAGATVGVLVFMTGVSFALIKVMGYSVRAFLPALVFPNTGNVGIPLSLFAFGAEGMALGVAYFSVCIVIQFTLGVAIASGSASPKSLLRVPTLYAVALAVFIMVTGIKLPEWAMNTFGLLGGFAIPLMLITLGISLARLQISTFGKTLLISSSRLMIGFGVSLAIAEALGLEGVMRGVLVLQSTLPVAVFNYLFAQKYNTDPETVAGAVVLSTVISFATLPLLLWFLL